MLSIVNFLHGLLARLLVQPDHQSDLDHLSLRDWADLPPHHPLCE